MPSMVDVRFAILGPLLIDISGRQFTVTAGRDRTLLAALVLTPGHPVPVPRLVDAVWGGKPPRNARNQVHGCVSRLRGQLAAAGSTQQLIVTDLNGHGYRLAVCASTLDVDEFRRLRTSARSAASDGDYVNAVRLYQAALARWRAPALVDVHSQLIRNAAMAIDEERLQVLEAYLAAQLAQGSADELVPELKHLVTEHPYRQRLRATLMLALYRAGRRAEAIAAHQETRRLFRDELGIEPGVHLRRLYIAILDCDPALEEPMSHPRQLLSSVNARGAGGRALP